MLPSARQRPTAKNMCGLDEHSSLMIAECLTGNRGMSHMCARLRRSPHLNRHSTSYNTLSDRLSLPAQDQHRLDYALTVPRVQMAMFAITYCVLPLVMPSLIMCHLFVACHSDAARSF